MAAYVASHERVLQLAEDAACDNNLNILWKALHHEALACHRLTDLFAAGHNFVDRIPLGGDAFIAIARCQVADTTCLLEAIIKGGIFGLTVDKPSHDAFNTAGGALLNSRGHRFETFGDNLLAKTPVGTRAMIVAAVEASLRSVLNTYGGFKQAASAGLCLPKAQCHVLPLLRFTPEQYEALKDVPVLYRRDRYRSSINPLMTRWLCDERDRNPSGDCKFRHHDFIAMFVGPPKKEISQLHSTRQKILELASSQSDRLGRGRACHGNTQEGGIAEGETGCTLRHQLNKVRQDNLGQLGATDRIDLVPSQDQPNEGIVYGSCLHYNK